MKWMHAEQGHITMCNVADPNLCGSLEARGILQKYITDPVDSTNRRVHQCRRLLGERCEFLFGEIYRSYTLLAQQACGDMESVWHPQRRIVVNRYATAELYDPNAPESVARETYFVFLGLVLSIWWLTFTHEFRQTVGAIGAIIFMPVSGKDELWMDERDGEKKNLRSASVLGKFLIIVFVLLPRTIVAVCLVYIGTEYLIEADSYADLILNSVALAFISDIDEMLFAAFVGEAEKIDLDNTHPIQGKFPCSAVRLCGSEITQLPPGIPLIMVVGGIVCYWLWFTISSPLGKYGLSVAYACLCHTEGSTCLTAQVLGGLPEAPAEDMPFRTSA
jgi:hypothetical protein